MILTSHTSSLGHANLGSLQSGDAFSHYFVNTLQDYNFNQSIKTDNDWMQFAFVLAQFAHGQTGTNPAVGAVIVKDGRLVGFGAHLKQGFEHAEIHALNMAGSHANGATIYVTLEPCCHFGKTGPCTEALINAGVKRVVIAIEDTNPRVGGLGIAQLKNAGIDVVTGILANYAKQIYHTFLTTQYTKRAYVILKTASSLDGKLALDNGQSQWITCDEARQDVHYLRASCDAIVTTISTVKADNPMLNVRLEGNIIQPTRVVIDRQGQIDLQAMLVQTAFQQPVILYGEYPPDKEAELIALGCEIAPYDTLEGVFQSLLKRGIMRVMIEAGSKFTTALLDENLVDEWIMYQSPRVLGGGHTLYNTIQTQDLGQITRFDVIQTTQIGVDIKVILRNRIHHQEL